MSKYLHEKIKYLLPVIPFSKNIITRGQGSYVFDDNEVEYLDINSGQFCSILGHSNPEISQQIAESLYKIQHTSTSMITDDVLYAAEKLNRISGDMDARSITLSTGGEAIEFCLRFAKHIKGKNGVVCFDKGYHGLTLGAQSITYGGKYSQPHVPLTFSVSIPDTFADDDEVESCIKEFENIASEHHKEIAVAIFEPIVSVGGMIIPPGRYFNEVRKICDQYDILLAFDECQTGFGRTGTWFYFQQLKCIPDIVVCAKGIGLGYPVSTVMFKSDLIPEDGFKMTHYSSHQNDAFSCAILNIGIDYIEKNKVLDSVHEKGKYFLTQLKSLSEQCSSVIKPRGVGLMLGADLQVNNVSDYRGLYKELYDNAQQKGLIIQGSNGGQTLRFLPSYLIERHEIDFCMGVLTELCSTLS